MQQRLETPDQTDGNKSLASMPVRDLTSAGNIATASSSRPNSNGSLKSEADKARAASAWAAKTGIDALRITQASELNESRLNILLNMARTSCRVARSRASKLKNPRGQLEISRKQAVEVFLNSYCGDVSKLDLLITQRLGPDETAFKSRPRDEDLLRLLLAKPSREVADALINEVLFAQDVDSARLIAPLVSEMTKPGGPLEAWQEFLPERPSNAELITIFTIAGETISCQQHRGCGANELLSMYQCLLEPNGCQLGEGLLAYRRRTTSPMLYQAAEQIAAAMQARRYR